MQMAAVLQFSNIVSAIWQGGGAFFPDTSGSELPSLRFFTLFR